VAWISGTSMFPVGHFGNDFGGYPSCSGEEFYLTQALRGNTTKVKKSDGIRQPFLIYNFCYKPNRASLVHWMLYARSLHEFVRSPAKTEYCLLTG
jgi:hypothetical protein